MNTYCCTISGRRLPGQNHNNMHKGLKGTKYMIGPIPSMHVFLIGPRPRRRAGPLIYQWPPCIKVSAIGSARAGPNNGFCVTLNKISKYIHTHVQSTRF